MRLRGEALAAFKQRAQDMQSRGLSLTRIAQLLHTSRWTVKYHLDPDYRMLKRAKMRKYAEVQGRIRALQAERGWEPTILIP